MQKIYFKKQIDLNHQLKELVSISVDESIQYKMETQGMRAIGSIMMNGEYKDGTMKKAFHESIDLDILAQFEKIIDKREFYVKVDDFDYTLNDGNLDLVIQACIYGVRDDEDRVIETQEIVEQSCDEVVEQIEDILREDEEISKPVTNEEVTVQKKENNQPVTNQNDDEDDEDLGTYYLYIVQDGDTYHSIAMRYNCDEYKLKEYNHERSLSKGAIVIIPYVI